MLLLTINLLTIPHTPMNVCVGRREFFRKVSRSNANQGNVELSNDTPSFPPYYITIIPPYIPPITTIYITIYIYISCTTIKISISDDFDGSPFSRRKRRERKRQAEPEPQSLLHRLWHATLHGTRGRNAVAGGEKTI